MAAGLKGRCPNCAQGPLFQGFLGVRQQCAVCGFDLRRADSGDGPAVFVILVAGALVGFAALLVTIAFRPPVWIHLVLWLPLTVVVCLGLLRPFKGVLVAMQFHHGAGGRHV
ncbi:DUF983 domain-containing protein [Brevundimonas sp.]|uniref:DUF983 domain-containing protein n=1 Tax=Brevundimonas sp. TaxID=1871086 RepID=UPI0025EEEA7E|nr:DUF983 domain-containing protein [Brevundimonas sp.]